MLKKAFYYLAAAAVLVGAASAQEFKSEVSVQSTGFFTKNSNGRGIQNQATETGGVLVGYRYNINRWLAAFDPSIGNWSFPCQSHYWIRRNKVVWARRWSKREIDGDRAQERIEYDEHFRARNLPGTEAKELPARTRQEAACGEAEELE